MKQQSTKKLVPLWTARFSADHVPPFKAHIGPQPTAQPTHFKLRLRLDAKNRPIPFNAKDMGHVQPSIERRLPLVKRVQESALPALNRKHDSQQKGPALTEALYRSAEAPARSARTATDLNRGRSR